MTMTNNTASPIVISVKKDFEKSSDNLVLPSPSISSKSPSLGLLDSIVTIIGLMIGSGIFTTVGSLQANVKSPGMALVLWIATGVLGLAGALCYSELGTMIPGSGGEGQYLQKGFGDWAMFVFNWASILLLKPSTIAIFAVCTSQYILGIWNAQGNNLFIKILSIGICWLVTFSAALSVKFSMKLQNILAFGKIGALAFVILSSIYWLIFRDHTLIKATLFDNLFAGTSTSFSSYSKAIVSGLWAFDGWNNLNLVAGNVKRPHRTLPLAIWISVTGVIGLYILTIIGYFVVLPVSLIESTKAVGIDFGTVIFGKWGGIAMAVMVACSTFGSALSSMATSSEVLLLASEIGHLPKMFGIINSKTGTAINAYLMQAVLASVMVFFQGFEDLLDSYVFPTFLFYGACTVVLMVLRFREPHLNRPYRVWWTTPIIFTLAAAFLIIQGVISDAILNGSMLVLVLLGLPVYYLFFRKSSHNNRERNVNNY